MKTGNNNRSNQIYTIEVGGVYRHYKGKLYKVIAVAHDSENPTSLRVIYEALYECPLYGKNVLWDRSYDMFVEQVAINGIQQPLLPLLASPENHICPRFFLFLGQAFPCLLKNPHSTYFDMMNGAGAN